MSRIDRDLDPVDPGFRDPGIWVLQILDPGIPDFGSCISWIPGSRIFYPGEPGSRVLNPVDSGSRVLDPGDSGSWILDPTDPGSRILDPTNPGSRILDVVDPGSQILNPTDPWFWILQILDPGYWILQILDPFYFLQILDPGPSLIFLGALFYAHVWCKSQFTLTQLQISLAQTKKVNSISTIYFIQILIVTQKCTH